MFLGDNDAQKDTKWLQVAMPWVSEIRKILRNGASTYEPSEAQAFWGRINGEKSGGRQDRVDKEEQPQGRQPVELRGRKRSLRVPGLQPLVPIGDEGHQLLL